jgi:hypothetical protein
MLRRRSVIVKAMEGYDPREASRAGSETLTLGFTGLDELVKGLPGSGRQLAAWWANETGLSQRHVQARAWLAASRQVDHIDFGDNRVIIPRA